MRGLGLASVGKGDAAAHLRPTSDRVRESIFNLLQNGGYGDPVDGARVLDLFAGTGALGLEALSRGAKACVFVDSGGVAGGSGSSHYPPYRSGSQSTGNRGRGGRGFLGCSQI